MVSLETILDAGKRYDAPFSIGTLRFGRSTIWLRNGTKISTAKPRIFFGGGAAENYSWEEFGIDAKAAKAVFAELGRYTALRGAYVITGFTPAGSIPFSAASGAHRAVPHHAIGVSPNDVMRYVDTLYTYGMAWELNIASSTAAVDMAIRDSINMLVSDGAVMGPGWTGTNDEIATNRMVNKNAPLLLVSNLGGLSDDPSFYVQLHGSVLVVDGRQRTDGNYLLTQYESGQQVRATEMPLGNIAWFFLSRIKTYMERENHRDFFAGNLKASGVPVSER